MILKFDLKLVVVDLMSHCWMWSKLNCFITSVVNCNAYKIVISSREIVNSYEYV